MRAPKWGIQKTVRHTPVRRGAFAVALSVALALTSARCVSDFVSTPQASKSRTVVPDRLVFSSQPASAVAGTAISSLQVVVQDSAGAAVTAGSETVTLTISGGTAGAHLRGTRAAGTVDGVATFTDLSIDSAGSDYRIVASSGSLETATSSSFDVSAGPAVRLGFVVQPSNTVANKEIEPDVRVGLQDSLGNTTGGSSVVVQLDLDPTSFFGPRLVGDVTKNTGGSGIATFTDLRVTRTGSFVLRASAPGYPETVSQPFSVLEPSDIIGLAVRVQPSTTVAGQPIAPSIKVATVNDQGNTVTTGTQAISLTIVLGTGTTAASLTGTTTVNATGGEATFTNVALDSAGVGYRLLATSPGLTADTTQAFDVTAGALAGLRFVVQPTTQSSGTAFTPPPRVHVLDAQGNLVTGATTSVALYITAGTGTPGATLSGPTTVIATAGVADFPGLSIAMPGAGYSLTAAAAGLTSDVSAAFDIGAVGPPPAASVVVTPSSASLSSIGDTQQFTADARDASGQSIPGSSFAWSTANGQVATVNGSGLATATGNGTVTITATSGGASGTASVTVQQVTTSVAILPSSPDTLVSIGETGTFAAEARDANGNAIAGKSIAWASEAPSVATIDAGTGIATAVSNGSATIRASVDGRTTTVTLVVRQVVATVTIAPDTMTLALSESRQLTASAADARGNPLARPLVFAWTSAHASVGVVVDPGDSSRATATRNSTSGPSSISITVTVEGVSGTAQAN